jgi:hypothetical protein
MSPDLGCSPTGWNEDFRAAPSLERESDIGPTRAFIVALEEGGVLGL